MSQPDWIRWYPARWLSGVLNLTNEQRGVYIQIINVLLDRGECPADYRYLGRVCNLRSHCVKRVVQELIIAGKLHETGSKLHQNRAESELKLARNSTETQRSRALKRWKNNGLAHAAPNANREEEDIDSEESIEIPSESLVQAKPAPYRSRFDEWWSLWPIGTKKGRDPAKQAFDAHVKHSRATPDEMIEALRIHADRWNKNGTRPEYIPHPKTWLNQHRWKDDPPPILGNGHGMPTNDENGNRSGKRQASGFAAAAARVVRRAKISDMD